MDDYDDVIYISTIYIHIHRLFRTCSERNADGPTLVYIYGLNKFAASFVLVAHIKRTAQIYSESTHENLSKG